LSGYAQNTTNNQMELTALIKALQQLKTTKYPLEIWTDSKYVLDGITKWIKKRRNNNRQTTSKTPVKNKELWEELDKLINNFDYEIHWVKAHANNQDNNFVDELARKQASMIEK
jgi:ribonuclease HI